MKFVPPVWRGAYNYDTRLASDEASVYKYPEPGVSMTVQSQAEDVDLNVIMKRFGVTGQMPENVRPVYYGDFTNVFDFRSAQDAIVRARESFDALPAEIRATFLNDPQHFLEYCSDPKNIDDMVKMGLAIPKEVKKDGADSVRAGGGGGADKAPRGDQAPAGGGAGADGQPAGGGVPAAGGAPKGDSKG